MFVRWIAGPVHVVRIPFIDRAGDGINTPSHENAKLGIFVPLRNLVIAESLPVGAVRPVVSLAIGVLDQGIPPRIVLRN